MNVVVVTSCLSFGAALTQLKNGGLVRRSGWNGKGMWLALVESKDYYLVNSIVSDDKLLPWIGMKTADDKFVPWLASQTDLLAEDWEFIQLVD